MTKGDILSLGWHVSSYTVDANDKLVMEGFLRTYNHDTLLMERRGDDFKIFTITKGTLFLGNVEDVVELEMITNAILRYLVRS